MKQTDSTNSRLSTVLCTYTMIDILLFAPFFFQNKFQVVIATDGLESFVIFLYDVISWSSSGSEVAQAGMNAGDGTRYFKFPGSGTPTLENLDVTSSTGIPGYHILSSGSGKDTNILRGNDKSY